MERIRYVRLARIVGDGHGLLFRTPSWALRWGRLFSRRLRLGRTPSPLFYRCRDEPRRLGRIAAEERARVPIELETLEPDRRALLGRDGIASVDGLAENGKMPRPKERHFRIYSNVETGHWWSFAVLRRCCAIYSAG